MASSPCRRGGGARARAHLNVRRKVAVHRREDVSALGERGGAWTPTVGAVLASRHSPDPAVRMQAAADQERLRDVLPHAIACGVRVLAGSDAVVTIAAEIALLVDCGLTIEQALAAAGSAARGFLGVEPEGDLVSYDADPRSDPEVLASPAAVVIRGVRVV